MSGFLGDAIVQCIAETAPVASQLLNISAGSLVESRQWDVSYASIVPWVETIRIARVQAAGRRARLM